MGVKGIKKFQFLIGSLKTQVWDGIKDFLSVSIPHRQSKNKKWHVVDVVADRSFNSS